MSWFGGSHKHEGPNFYPVTSYLSGMGELTDKDTEFSCITGKGFQTETKTWYSVLDDGSVLMVQVIWSFLGIFMVPATAQMTFKLYNPATKQSSWKSVNVSGFKHEGANCKSDSFDVKLTGSASGEEVYTISGNLDKDVQINVTFTKPASAPGWKYGSGDAGGFSTFGHGRSEEKREGFVVHRFHPIVKSGGTIALNGQLVEAKGEGMFVHAIQGGMRPNLIASRWNFAFFTSGGGEEQSELGDVRAIQMEFTTTDGYGPGGKVTGRTKVNIGCVYTSSLPKSALIVTGQTHAPEGTTAWPTPNKDVSVAEHLRVAKDDFTGYDAPHGLAFEWAAPRADGAGNASASVKVDDAMSGLMEKVDVLAEIPYVLRKGLAAVTGTKPFIFQYYNKATLEVDVGDKKIPVKGWMFNEASFISQ